MNRTLIAAGITAFLLGAAISVEAKSFEAGVIIGEPTGLVAKFWQNKTTAFDVAVAWSLGSEALHVHADYLIHKYDLLKLNKRKLPVYFGLGAKVVLLSDLHAGLRIPLGVVLPIKDTPLKIGLEVVPTVDLLPGTGVGFNGALAITYSF
jgi:hypothetical protein